MKKMFSEVKSYLTIVLCTTFVITELMGIQTSDFFKQVVLMVISVYFGVQLERNNKK